MKRINAAIHSYQSLSLAFLHVVVWKQQKSPLSSDKAIVPACHIDAETTRFFLDWSDTSVEECAGTDWIVIFILFLMVHAVSWLTRWLVWEPSANWLARKNPAFDVTASRKISMCMTAALFHSLSGMFVLIIIGERSWLRDPVQWRVVVSTIDPAFKFYYLLYAARFISDMISLPFEERPRDALKVAFIHHITTLTLVLGSAHWGFTRGGGVIMSFFDWSDPPLLLAKCCKYLSTGPDDMYQFCANRLFEIFVVIFLITRNGLYNYVVYNAYRHGQVLLEARRTVCFTALVSLAALQTYWLLLIIKALSRRKQAGGNVEDVREETTTKKVQ